MAPSWAGSIVSCTTTTNASDVAVAAAEPGGPSS